MAPTSRKSGGGQALGGGYLLRPCEELLSGTKEISGLAEANGVAACPMDRDEEVVQYSVYSICFVRTTISCFCFAGEAGLVVESVSNTRPVRMAV
jgi:hypothetical protein